MVTDMKYYDIMLVISLIIHHKDLRKDKAENVDYYRYRLISTARMVMLLTPIIMDVPLGLKCKVSGIFVRFNFFDIL
jgi:hypothetical protein